MPTPARTHDHRPLWVAGHVRATCRAHWWQPLGWAAADAPKAGAR